MATQLSLFDSIKESKPKTKSQTNVTIDVTNPKNIKPFYENLKKYPLAYVDRECRIKRSNDETILISPKTVENKPALIITGTHHTYCAIWKNNQFELQNYNQQILKPFKSLSQKSQEELLRIFETYADDIDTLFIPRPTEESRFKELKWPSKKTIDEQLTDFYKRHQTPKEKVWRIKHKNITYTIYHHDNIIELYRKKAQKPKRLIAILSNQGAYTTDDFNPSADQIILHQ